jgi:hypothetical protein
MKKIKILIAVTTLTVLISIMSSCSAHRSASGYSVNKCPEWRYSSHRS